MLIQNLSKKHKKSLAIYFAKLPVIFAIFTYSENGIKKAPVNQLLPIHQSEFINSHNPNPILHETAPPDDKRGHKINLVTPLSCLLFSIYLRILSIKKPLDCLSILLDNRGVKNTPFPHINILTSSQFTYSTHYVGLLFVFSSILVHIQFTIFL